ncbi:MAG: hypothetical protein JSS32_10215 [Verrucomicrobia bacterium]|nr:hypothetical protein [Verrucomicrobiota bacterium]
MIESVVSNAANDLKGRLGDEIGRKLARNFRSSNRHQRPINQDAVAAQSSTCKRTLKIAAGIAVACLTYYFYCKDQTECSICKPFVLANNLGEFALSVALSSLTSIAIAACCKSNPAQARLNNDESSDSDEEAVEPSSPKIAITSTPRETEDEDDKTYEVKTPLVHDSSCTIEDIDLSLNALRQENEEFLHEINRKAEFEKNRFAQIKKRFRR